MIKQAKLKFEKSKRSYIIYKNQRWQTFRVNKEIIVDEWLDRKRKQRLAEGWYRAMIIKTAIKSIKK